MNAILSGLLVAVYLPVSVQPHDLSMADYLRDKCQQGDTKACQRFEAMEEEQKQAEEMEKRAIAFSRNFDNEHYEQNNKPDLEAAYPVVMRDYFQFEAEAGNGKLILDEARLRSCARHYHNYWVNRKLWWPTTEAGRPDWTSIYIYIVDHYFGYCLRQF